MLEEHGNFIDGSINRAQRNKYNFYSLAEIIFRDF